MPKKLAAFLLGFFLLALTLPGRAQLLFDDNFNGSNVTTNNGAEAVNPTDSTTAFGDTVTTGANTTGPTQAMGGAFFNPPSGGFGIDYLAGETGNETSGPDAGTAYSLATPLAFSITLNDVTVITNSNAAAGAPYGSGKDAGYRWELGVVSANTPLGANSDLYDNTQGGLYISLYYDKAGDLVGALRGVNNTHAALNDSGAGTSNLALFTLPPNTGSPLTVSFILTSTGYTVEFNEPVTVNSGSLSGTYSTPGITTEFDDGVRLNLVGQDWQTGPDGAGSGFIENVEVMVVPEPGTWALMMAGMAFLLLMRRPLSRRWA